MKKIILIGAGGQAISCIDVINLTKNYKKLQKSTIMFIYTWLEKA